MKDLIKSKKELDAYEISSKIFQPNLKLSNLIIQSGSKFYQKIFLVLISLSSILIFPESPSELEVLCKTHNSSQICRVW